MRILYLGSFDPAHSGHFNTYLNALKYFGEPIEICICMNDLKEGGLFSLDERLLIARSVFPDAVVSAHTGKEDIRQLILSADAFVRGYRDEADKQYALGLSRYYGVAELVDKVHFFEIEPQFVEVNSTNIKARLFSDPEFVKSAVGELGYRMLLEKLGNK